jgi:hypothetical protein
MCAETFLALSVGVQRLQVCYESARSCWCWGFSGLAPQAVLDRADFSLRKEGQSLYGAALEEELGAVTNS